MSSMYILCVSSLVLLKPRRMMCWHDAAELTDNDSSSPGKKYQSRVLLRVSAILIAVVQTHQKLTSGGYRVLWSCWCSLLCFSSSCLFGVLDEP